MKKSRLCTMFGAICFGSTLAATQVHAAAGGLDPTFGKGGKVVTSISNCGTGICNLDPVGAALQPDDKIVIGLGSGASACAVGAVRYLANGTLDSTFGTGGFAPAVAGIGLPNAIALEPNGQIIVTGESSGITFTVVRYKANGTWTQLSALTVWRRRLNWPAAKGWAKRFSSRPMARSSSRALFWWVAREHREPRWRVSIPTAARIRHLDQGGAELTSSTVGADALAELSDGDILVVDHKGIAQLNSTGGLESTVTSGTIEVSSPAGVFLSDGHFFDAEAVSPFRHATEAEVFELNPAGSADSAFNNPMFAFVSGVQHASARSIGFQSDGKVVVGGSQCNGGSCVDGLARLNMNGSLDSGFGSSGDHQFLGTGFRLLLAPAIIRLLRDPGLAAGLRRGLATGHRHFDLPQQTHDLFRLVLLDWHTSAPPARDSLSRPLVQKSPVTSSPTCDNGQVPLPRCLASNND
jgi:uncharacterized delta-60 repeat protein